MKKNYYDLLGLTDEDKKLPFEEFKLRVKKQYRSLCKINHPDKGGDADTFKEIAEAYEVLSDKDKRHKYDLYGHQDSNTGGYNPMEDFIRRTRYNREKQVNRGPNMNLVINLTLEEVYSGTSKKYKYQRKDTCTTCNGKGGTEPKTCATCHGSGLILEIIRTPFGEIRNSQSCPTCSGDGETYENTCIDCIGTGVKSIEDSIDLGIPAGVIDGMRMIMQGKGHAAKNAIAGDLIITIVVLSHPYFVRINDDLKTTLKVTYPQLILGDKIEVSTIEGKKIRISVPELTKVGKILRIQNKGLKPLNSDVRGDMLIEIDLFIPNEISDEEKDLIIELKKLGDKVATQ